MVQNTRRTTENKQIDLGMAGSKLHEKNIKLKKDWVTFLAVSLFFVIVLSEIALVIFLPMQLRSKQVWERDAALDKMITLEDLLRAHLIDFKDEYRHQYDKGNAEMIKKCLDENARYIRAYRDQMDRDQIRVLYNYLRRFDKTIYNLSKKRINITFEKIDPSVYVDHLYKTSKKVKIEYPYLSQREKTE